MRDDERKAAGDKGGGKRGKGAKPESGGAGVGGEGGGSTASWILGSLTSGLSLPVLDPKEEEPGVVTKNPLRLEAAGTTRSGIP